VQQIREFPNLVFDFDFTRRGLNYLLINELASLLRLLFVITEN